MGLLFLLVLGLAAIGWVSFTKRRSRDRRAQALQSREFHLRGSALKAYVYRLPDFRFTHCLVGRNYHAAVALEENTGRLCLIDAATPHIYHRLYSATDLLDVSLSEQDLPTPAAAPASADYNVLVGGVAFGWLGALLGYLFSARSKPAFVPTSGSLELQLKVNDTRTPLWRITFLLDPVRKTSPSYLKACETALQWQALLGVIRQRARGALAPSVRATINGPAETAIYQVRHAGKNLGAMSRARIRALLSAGHLATGDRYFDPQLQDWLTLDLLPES